MRRVVSAVGVFAAVMGLTLVAPGGAFAATDTVTNCNGSGAGSLPDTVANAAAGDTITFDSTLSCATTNPITPTSTLTIAKDLTITGPTPGTGAIAVSGGGTHPVLGISSATVTISGLTIENGTAVTSGGGMDVDSSTLTLTDSTVAGNTATGLPGVHAGSGGGIFANQSTVTLIDSTVSGNTAMGDPTPTGQPGFGGGILSTGGTLTVIDSTIARNTATDGGSALGPGLGGGIFGSLDRFGNSATVNIGGSIVADNTAAGFGPNCFIATRTSLGYNLTNDTTGTLCGFTATGDVFNAEPDLGPLADNGGPTRTMLPARGSPAVGVVPPNTTLNGVSVCPRTDQRGVASVPGATCTIGAVEVPSCPFTAPSTDGLVSGDQATASATFTSPPLTTTSGADLLLAFVAADGPTAPTQMVRTVTGGGLTWSLAARENQTWGTTEVWQAFATAPLSAVKVRAKLGFAYDGAITVAAFHGAASQVGATATAAAQTGTPTATVTPQACNSLVWAAVHDWTNAITPVPASGQTLAHSFIDQRVNDSFWTQKVGDSTAAANAPVTVTTTGPVNDRWTIAAVEIRAAG